MAPYSESECLIPARLADHTQKGVQRVMERGIWAFPAACEVMMSRHRRRTAGSSLAVETYPGTEIGLAIVRRATESMSGKFGVESEASGGSRFWVELPSETS